MAVELSRCPSLVQLEGLLAERLSGPELTGVETHVECCVSCQEHLERLMVTTLDAISFARHGRSEPEIELREAFLQHLQSMSPAAHDVRFLTQLPTSRNLIPTDAPRWVNGRLGNYEILERLGAGGMGAVYKARHVELGRIVALKVLPAELKDEGRIARFRNEIRAIGRLNHPHIVAARDAGEMGGVHFLVMEFVEGLDLACLLDRWGRWPVADACEATRQAALGLQHAYECGLVHRDVKPSNLMVTPGGRVQLLDLGLARSFAEASAETLTPQGMVLGTADYLAPEQWEHAHKADTHADIYSLGCTLFHLLAGRPLFDGDHFRTVLQKMRAHLECSPPSILQVRTDVPAELGNVLNRMLAKKPTDRYRSPGEVAEALQPFTYGADLARLLGPGKGASLSASRYSQAIANPSPSLPSPLSKRRARLLILATAASLCLFLLFAGLLGRRHGKSAVQHYDLLEISELQIHHFRASGAQLLALGELRTGHSAVRLDDKLEIAAQLSAPAYYYLIAFNPRGSEAGLAQLCQPATADGQGAETVPPDLQTEVQYPYSFIPDAAGLQVFVLAASRRPLPSYRDWLSQVGPVPWEGGKAGATWRWHFNGREFLRFPLERGRVEPKDGVPESLRRLCEFFVRRPEIEAVQTFAFPVIDERP